MVTSTRGLIYAIEFEYSLLLGHHDDVHKFIRIIHWDPNLTWAEYLTFVAFNFQILIFI